LTPPGPKTKLAAPVRPFPAPTRWEASRMQCPRCQHENSSRAKFCEECATPLGSDLLELWYPALGNGKVLPRVRALCRCRPKGIQ
jgi:predicted amidophosphoribosyltransferase